MSIKGCCWQSKVVVSRFNGLPLLPDLPALILEAQVAADGDLLQAKGPGREGGFCKCLSGLVDILCDGTEECGRCEALEVLSNC